MDQKTLKILERARDNGSINWVIAGMFCGSQEHASTALRWLVKEGYLEDTRASEPTLPFQVDRSEGSGSYHITPKGLAYLEDAKKQAEKDALELKRYKRQEFRAWFTLVIAVLGFVLAVIALLWQGITEGHLTLGSSTMSAPEQSMSLPESQLSATSEADYLPSSEESFELESPPDSAVAE